MTTKLQTFDGNIGIGTHDPGAYRLRVDGAFRANALEINGVTNAQVPVGLIAMWWGTVASIPTGWALCDGFNSTLDLRGQFIRGASGDAPSPEAVGTSGGGNTVTLSTANLATHTHTGNSGTQSGNHGHTATVGNQSGNHGHTATVGSQSANHTHPLTTGNQSASHSHPTGNQRANHTHTATTANNSANHTHSASIANSPHPHTHAMSGLRALTSRNQVGNPNTPAANLYGNFAYCSTPISCTIGGRDTNNAAYPHTHPFTTSNASAGHTHPLTVNNNSANHSHPTGNQTANHTHAGTTAGDSATHNHTVTNVANTDTHNHTVTNVANTTTHNHTLTLASAGSGTAVGITNPYYALMYIVKT
jgi:hypothetical protein